jgi:hypothetical protein
MVEDTLSYLQVAEHTEVQEWGYSSSQPIYLISYVKQYYPGLYCTFRFEVGVPSNCIVCTVPTGSVHA